MPVPRSSAELERGSFVTELKRARPTLFTRMRSVFNLHLRQAEAALSEGRFEEAAELATRADVRQHHDGQKLLSRLTAALVARGQ